jgi:hypothetical protein
VAISELLVRLAIVYHCSASGRSFGPNNTVYSWLCLLSFIIAPHQAVVLVPLVLHGVAISESLVRLAIVYHCSASGRSFGSNTFLVRLAIVYPCSASGRSFGSTSIAWGGNR